jgi:hypothetical protein
MPSHEREAFPSPAHDTHRVAAGARARPYERTTSRDAAFPRPANPA